MYAGEKEKKIELSPAESVYSRILPANVCNSLHVKGSKYSTYLITQQSGISVIQQMENENEG